MTKKINYNNPTFWASINYVHDSEKWFCNLFSYRIRVIYPNGVCRFFTTPTELETKGSASCFYKNGMTHKQTIEAMKKYDKKNNRTTIYLGQITLKGEE